MMFQPLYLRRQIAAFVNGLQGGDDRFIAEVTTVRDKLTKHIKGSDGFGGGDAKELTIIQFGKVQVRQEPMLK